MKTLSVLPSHADPFCSLVKFCCVAFLAIAASLLVVGCAVRGLHLDVDDAVISPRGADALLPQPIPGTNLSPVKDEDPLVSR